MADTPDSKSGSPKESVGSSPTCGTPTSMQARIFTPPSPTPSPSGRKTIFLAGSIEMGTAEHWQKRVIEFLAQYPVDIYNPRREHWDPSWEQSIQNPEFKTQVNWELDHIETADIPAFYFDPNTKSPITLLELGLSKGKALVICSPKGFWRRGNLEIICDRWKIPLLEKFEEYLSAIREKLI